mmetsp:Transcript_9288/g.17099  ORF Transcript_9288/g.17099 Transcript_9288/m.17099 type:complete len:382 (-) Transcript_9288:137-1282(-)
MLRLLLLPVAALAAGQEAAPISAPAPPPLQGEDLEYMLSAGPDESSPYKDLVADPLQLVVVKIEEVVAQLLQHIADTVHSTSGELKTLHDMGPQLRSVLGSTVVPYLLAARDNSSAVDPDERPSKRSKARYAQNVLLKLQEYTSYAWPVLEQYSQLAFSDQPMTAEMNMRMQRGTNGSLQYLRTVLGYAWIAAEYQYPVVQALMKRTDSSGDMLVKAGCSANYAQLLGDITEVYSDLSKSKVYCFQEKWDASTVMNASKAAERQCAVNSMMALSQVTKSIAEAANAMWQCFGSYWGCAQLLNSAYTKLAKVYAASFTLSEKCGGDPIEAATCKSTAFEALGDLSAARGLMQSSAEDCDIQGGTLVHPLNPWAATPFEQADA